MIFIDNQAVGSDVLGSQFPSGSVEMQMIDILSSSREKYNYASEEELKFELRMRKEIIAAAKALHKSGMSFAVFRKVKRNEDFWDITDEGGLLLKDGVLPSDAINDIFRRGSQYATECATAMVIVYYKTLLTVFGEEAFNRLFPKIELMNWRHIDKNLKEIGYMHQEKDYLPGDRRYFANPDVDPKTPEWQGENVIDLDQGLYFGHGIGINTADTMIRALNKNRKEDAEQSAHLLDSAGRPNFPKLYELYAQSIA